MNNQRSTPRIIYRLCLLGILSLAAVAFPRLASGQGVAVTGELKRWHKVTLTLDGPAASEGGTPNPFLDYRMNVTFSNTTSGLTYKVPGYFAADGNAAESSATSGNKWRAHLSPDDTGTWTYAISFRSGTDVAVNASTTAGTALAPYDGVAGSFSVAESDKTGRDFRGRGRLEYVNKHHLRFAGDGAYFMKAGADSPENFLAYDDFDNTPDTAGRRKSWNAHTNDWNSGDPLWKSTKGKGIIGAVNYLAEKGCNVQSFLTYNYNGDDKNVFMYASPTDRLRMDCSKLDQWEIVFGQFDRMGVYLHFKTQEQENDQDLDGGALGTERKLYYRELIARYGHHLALNWNLGEENTNTDAQRKAFAQYFYDHDPYRHLVVVHTFPASKDSVYAPLLGSASKITGASLQSDPSSVFNDTKKWVTNSAANGKPWVVANDEQGSASTGIDCDSADAAHNGVRSSVLWGNLMAGGAGVETYYGYQTCESDLTSENHRSRDTWYSQCAHALRFFHDFGVPFWDMSNQDNLVSGATGARCLRKPGESYVIQLPGGGTPSLNLAGAPGNFEVKWFNPRTGGNLQNGSVLNVIGGGTGSLGSAPSQTTQDWIVLVRSVGGVFANAGTDQTKQFPQSTNQVSVSLNGSVSAGGNPFTATWSQISGPGSVTFANSNAPATTAVITGNPGAYVLQLAAASGTNNASDTMTVTANAWTPDTTPPVVIITAPANGATVLLGTTVNVTASITDNDAVQSGELFVDGSSQGVDPSAPFAWLVNGLSLGAHTLAVRGLDVTGNAATNSISLTVSSNLPTASTITNVAVQDAYIQDTAGAITVVDTTPLRVENDTPARTRDTYLRFNITDIPAGATINSVTLRLNNQRPTTANGTYVVYAGSAAAWADASPGPNTLANGLITAGAQIGQFINPAPSSQLNVPLSASFITGNGSFNVVIKKTTVSNQDVELSTSENATVDLRPALIIDLDSVQPDVQPPVVSFVSPVNGDGHPSEQPLPVVVDASDNVSVAEVTLALNGIVVDGLFAPPWVFSGQLLPTGLHVLTVRGVDTSGNAATNSITILVTDTPPNTGGEGVIYTELTDQSLKLDRTDGATLGSNGEGELSIPVGGTGTSNGFDRCSITVFKLPDLGAVNNPFTTVNFGVYLSSETVTSGLNGDLYGLGRRASPTVQLSDYWGYTSAIDPTDAVLLQDNFLTPAGLTGDSLLSTSVNGSEALRNYLNEQYAGGAGIDDYVFLRISGDAVTAGTARYNLISADGAAGNLAQTPQIAYTYGTFTPLVAITVPVPGGFYLDWSPESWVLEQATDLTSGDWFEVSGAQPPYQVLTTEPQQFFRTRPAAVTPTNPPPTGDPLVLWATTNFPNINAGAVPSYKDTARNALAIDAANVSYRGQFAAAQTTFAGTAGTYNITLTTLTETDGECTYRVLINGVQQGTFTNPRATVDYQEVNQTFSNITVPAGATIRVEFNTHSNGLIPEGSGFAWARGRWRKLAFAPNVSAPSGAWVETGGMVVMEAEKTSSAYGNWAKVNPGDALYVNGATGTGHIQFNGNSPSGGTANSPLVYQFKINQTGTYRLYLRARKNLEGAASDLCNDAYVKLAGNYTAGAGGGYLSLLQNNTKFFGGNPTSWGWAQQLDDTSVNPDVKYSALYNFTAGEIYTFTMSGRSQRFNVDRIVFRLNGTADATWQNAPESPRAP